MSGGTRPGRGAAERLARGLLRAASWLVPDARREAWREEWESEVWHHLNGSGRGPRPFAGAAVVVRCLGALPHALWIRGEEWDVDTFAQDVRFAVRSLRHRPVFALVAIGTLALGIGGNTAVFSVVDAVLLRPLPLPNADRIVFTWGREFNGSPTASVSAPDYLDYRAGTDQVFEDFGAYSSFSSGMVYADGDRPVELSVRLVTPELLRVLGVQPLLGRGITEEEMQVEEPAVAMLSHGTWGRLFGFSPDVVGSTIRLDGRASTIVGVLPEGLTFPSADVWLPFTFGAEWYGSRSAHFMRPLGLLQPGVELEQAQRAMDVVSARLEAAYPETNDGWYAVLQPLQTVFVGPVGPALLMLLAAIGVVLLIACGNVANLLLARAVARRGEVAVRAALGASRGRVVRQLLTESLILALAGGAAGVALARAGVWALQRLQPGNIPRIDEVAISGSVLAFALLVSVAVGVLFGLAPALGLASRDVASPMRSSGRGESGRRGRARSALVVGEVALSFVLLTGAVLLVRSFLELRAVEPGIDPAGVVALSLTFPDREPAERVVALDGVLERVRAHPGVVEAGAATALPFSGTGGDTYVYDEDRPPEQIRNIQNTALLRTVDESYFRAMGQQVLLGRTFQRADAVGIEPRVVVNEALVRRLYANEDPLGQRLVAHLDSVTALEIVGVVADVRQFGLGSNPYPEFFLSARQFPVADAQLVVRGDGGRALPMDGVREAVWDADPTQPLARSADLSAMVEGSLAPGRFQAVLLGLFAVLAVLLAGVGLYGVLAEGVHERRREIGVRMAMGAQPSRVVRHVVGQGLFLAGLGVVLGALGAYAATDLLSTFLFGVGPRDPWSFALTPAFLLLVVGVSCWVPAHHAARVDPVQALREEA